MLKDISPELKKRTQGISCFNFTAVDEERFAELARLNAAGLERFPERKLL